MLYQDATSVGGSLNVGAFDEIGRSRLILSKENHLEFGKGDIGIHMGDTSDVALLLFRNLKKPAPIGRLVGDDSAKVTELLDTDVLMSFSNVESIDALMKCLLMVRQKMQRAL